MTKSTSSESNTPASSVPVVECSARLDRSLGASRGTLIAALVGLSIFLCSGVSEAQFAVDLPVDSARAPFSIGASYLGSFQFESTNATGSQVLVGVPSKMVVNFVTNPFVLADIPGNKTSVLTVSALRATFTITGLVGWEPVGTFAIRARFPQPFAIAAGQKVGCRYDMPLQTFIFDMNTGVTSVPPSPGRLRCQPGVLASDIPAPTSSTPAPAPVPAPTPTPAPVPVPPAPAPAPMPVTIKMPPVTSITDSTGGVWTSAPMTDAGAPGQFSLLLNGQPVNKNSVSLLCFTNGQIWNNDPLPPVGSGLGWEPWTGTGWGPVQASGPAACQ